MAKTSIGYKIVPNNSPTQDAAPYTGQAIPNGSLAFDNILKSMVDGGTRMTVATARFFLEAFYELVADITAVECRRASTGTVSVFPAISGSFPSEDADFDPERNRLFVDAALSKSLQEQVAALAPGYAGEPGEASSVRISSAYDLGTMERGVVRGTGELRLAGVNLAVPDGEDESLGLWKADLSEKVADFVVVSTDGGQRITVRLADTAEVAKGKYKIRLASHGLDPTAKLAVVTLPVTVVEAVVPPAPVPGPTVTAVWSDYTEELPEGYDEDAVVVEDMPIHVRGANLDGATVRLVGTGGASSTLTLLPDMCTEGVWAFEPTSGNFTNPCAIVVTSAAGTANFAVKYYKPE